MPAEARKVPMIGATRFFFLFTGRNAVSVYKKTQGFDERCILKVEMHQWEQELPLCRASGVVLAYRGVRFTKRLEFVITCLDFLPVTAQEIWCVSKIIVFALIKLSSHEDSPLKLRELLDGSKIRAE
jgi:hypothetical protein